MYHVIENIFVAYVSRKFAAKCHSSQISKFFNLVTKKGGMEKKVLTVWLFVECQ